jgi:hypothetical protein
MNWTELVAFIGAAAWLPHIFYLLYVWLSKPRLRFVPESSTEIGYTTIGPIFNQTFAISTSKKDALVERVSLVVIHEAGEKHEFHWKALDEKGFEMTSISGERAEFRKNQTAIALKISVLGLVEKKIFFRDFAFQEKLLDLFNKYSEKALHFEKTASEKFKDEAIKLKEFMDLLDFIKSGFYWREGKYDVYLYAFEASLKKPHVEHFEFMLSKRHAEQLEKNIETTQNELKNTILLYKDTDVDKWPKVFWNWVNPAFCRINKKG